MDYTLSAPIGKTAGADYGRFDDPAGAGGADAVRERQHAGRRRAAAITTLADIMSTQVPVAPLLLGRVVGGVLHPRTTPAGRRPSNPYMDPGPNIPEILYTVQHLKPVS